MLIVELSGGLGNQMFQYAFGLALQNKTDLPVKYIFRDALRGTKRVLELETAFQIDLPVASNEEIGTILKWPYISDFLIAFCKRKPGFGENICRVYSDAKDRRVSIDEFSDLDGAYFAGYWQSHKWFSQCESTVRSKFRFCETNSIEFNSWVDWIESNEPIAVHVRRGDYISDESAARTHGFIGKQYFLEGIDQLRSNDPNKPVLFFGDDKAWLDKALVPIVPNSRTCKFKKSHMDYFDMALMSLCGSVVGSNSSFTWWSAWLGSTTKQVIVPQQWYLKEELLWLTEIPEVWMRI